MYWDDAPAGPEHLPDDFFLSGAAFLKMDGDRVTRIGPASQVQIHLEQARGTATISGVMHDITYFEPGAGNFTRAATMTILPNALPFTLPMKLKFLGLSELFSLRSQPERWPEVLGELEKLRVEAGQRLPQLGHLHFGRMHFEANEIRYFQRFLQQGPDIIEVGQ